MNILMLIISIIVAEGTGALSFYLGMSEPENYKNFIRPNLYIPSWSFIVALPILYFLMAYAAYRVWIKREKEYIGRASTMYLIQLALNFLWPIVFFRFRLIGLAFIELMLLLIFILLAFFEFFRIDKKAGLLIIPYILCVSFAGVINYIFWMLNNM